MVMMPEGAAASRAAQKSALAGVLHEKQTDPAIGALLQRLQGLDLSSLGPYEQARTQAGRGRRPQLAVCSLRRQPSGGCARLPPAAGPVPTAPADLPPLLPRCPAAPQANVREAARDYKKATAVPKELAQKEAELESRGYQARRLGDPGLGGRSSEWRPQQPWHACWASAPERWGPLTPANLPPASPSPPAPQAWVKARQESDFAAFAPVLREWVDLRKQKAALVDSSRCAPCACRRCCRRRACAHGQSCCWACRRSGLRTLSADPTLSTRLLRLAPHCSSPGRCAARCCALTEPTLAAPAP